MDVVQSLDDGEVNQTLMLKSMEGEIIGEDTAQQHTHAHHMFSRAAASLSREPFAGQSSLWSCVFSCDERGNRASTRAHSLPCLFGGLFCTQRTRRKMFPGRSA